MDALNDSEKKEYHEFICKIHHASGYSQLLQLHEAMPDYIRRCFLEKKVPGSEACLLISHWHDLIMTQVIQRAEAEIQKQIGHELPPFSWMLFGSGGREEPTFWTDQDNGLVYLYPENEDSDPVDEWFQHFAEKVVKGLEKVGYPLCEGNVMATNPRWRGPLDQWQKRFELWAKEPISEHHRFLMIAADLRHVYGDPALSVRLRTCLNNILQQYPGALSKAAEFHAQLRLPVGAFQQWYKERYGKHAGTVNIKLGGYLQMSGAIRILSCKYSLHESSTSKRIQQSCKQLSSMAKYATELQQSLDVLLTLRLVQHVLDEENGKEPEDYIDPGQLEKPLQKKWKQAIRWAHWLQKEAIRQCKKK